MNIAWKYLDKRNATINALKDYETMKMVIEHTDKEIRLVVDSMVDVHSPNLDNTGNAHRYDARETFLAARSTQIDVLKERYAEAKEYMNWMQPAWDALKENERKILYMFYVDNEYGEEVADKACELFGIERNSVYKRKNRALDHLKALLYGID